MINKCFLCAIALVLIAGGCRHDKPVAKKTFTMGIQVSPAMTLVMVAKEKGLFKKEGVNVEIKEFTAGKFALQAFLSGSIDFAVSGEVPVALATLQGNEVVVVAQVVEKTVNEVRIVANSDGSKTPEEFFSAKRRKLATSFGGGPEFFTYRFLQKYGIESDDIEIVSQKPADMPASLRSGSVDAIAIFDPFAFIAEKQIGIDSITFSDEDLYSELYVLDATRKQLQEHPEEVKAILRALKASGEFILQNPDESKSIMQRWTKLDKEVVNGVWDNFVFRSALTQELVDVWGEQAEWAVKTGKVKAGGTLPDFRAIIDESFLKAVDEPAVKLAPLELPLKKAG